MKPTLFVTFLPKRKHQNDDEQKSWSFLACKTPEEDDDGTHCCRPLHNKKRKENNDDIDVIIVVFTRKNDK